jgi:hypothetical protein
MNSNSRIIYTKNDRHLGDNIFCCIVFCKIKKYIEENNIFINHYCKKEYIDQIDDFKYSQNITILPLEEIKNDVKVFDLWMNCKDYEIYYHNSSDPYEIFLAKFYNNILKLLNIPIEITQFLFDNDDLLEREKEINNKTNNKYTNIDFLFINGTPMSEQLDYDVNEWDRIIKLFDQKYNVVTTQKVDGVKCTRDDNLLSKDIGAISTKVKKIIAIDSGVACSLFNIFTINNAEVVYFMSKYNNCTFPNFVNKKNISDVLLLLIDDVKEPMDNFHYINYNNSSIVYSFLLFFLILLFSFYCFFIYFIKKSKKRYLTSSLLAKITR